MKNLDQIRAANAWAARDTIGTGANQGDIVKKVPTMIMENGFLAAAAFAKDSSGGYKTVFMAITVHLQTLGIMEKKQGASVDDLITWLSAASSAKLREVTVETMAYLSYLRRFVQK